MEQQERKTHRLQQSLQRDMLRKHAEHAKHKAAFARRRLFAEYGEEASKLGRRPKGAPIIPRTPKEKKPLPVTVEALIRAYCADYDRRARIIAAADREAEALSRKAAPALPLPHPMGKECAKRITVRRTSSYPVPLINRLKETNALIDDAIAATCDKSVAEVMRSDLGQRLGHRRTSLYFMGEKAYHRQKRRAKLAIAAALELM